VHAIPAAGTPIQPGVLPHHHLALHLHPPCWGFVVTLLAVDGIASVLAAAVANPLIDV